MATSVDERLERYHQEKRGMRKTTAGTSLLAGSSVIGGVPVQLPPSSHMSDMERAKMQVELIRVAERMTRYEGEQEQQRWEFAKSRAIAKANMADTMADILVGQIDAKAKVRAAYDSTRLIALQKSSKDAKEIQYASGWGLNKDRMSYIKTGGGGKIQAYAVYRVVKPDGTIGLLDMFTPEGGRTEQVKKFQQQVVRDLLAARSPQEKAFFLDELSDFVGDDMFAMMLAIDPVTDYDAQIVENVEEASYAITKMKAVDDAAWSEHEKFHKELDEGGSHVDLDPEILRQTTAIIRDNLRTQDTPYEWSTSVRPPPMDANEYDKQKFIQSISAGDLVYNPKTKTITYSVEAAAKLKADGIRPTEFSYESFIETMPQPQRTRLEKTDDYIDNMMQELSTSPARNMAELRNQLFASAEFQVEKDRLFGDQDQPENAVSDSYALQAMEKYSRQRRREQRAAPRRARRDDILKARDRSTTPAQWRRAQVMEFLSSIGGDGEAAGWQQQRVQRLAEKRAKRMGTSGDGGEPVTPTADQQIEVLNSMIAEARQDTDASPEEIEEIVSRFQSRIDALQGEGEEPPAITEADTQGQATPEDPGVGEEVEAAAPEEAEAEAEDSPITFVESFIDKEGQEKTTGDYTYQIDPDGKLYGVGSGGEKGSEIPPSSDAYGQTLRRGLRQNPGNQKIIDLLEARGIELYDPMDNPESAAQAPVEEYEPTSSQAMARSAREQYLSSLGGDRAKLYEAGRPGRRLERFDTKYRDLVKEHLGETPEDPTQTTPLSEKLKGLEKLETQAQESGMEGSQDYVQKGVADIAAPVEKAQEKYERRVPRKKRKAEKRAQKMGLME